MNYKNGKDVLPPSLLKELQHYIQGELLYIPKPRSERAGWGEKSGSRVLIERRNEEIYGRYVDGCTVAELERIYHLSGESIRKIILKVRSAASFRLEESGEAPGRKDYETVPLPAGSR
ncbi:CD3324 family protein [Paenibacillus humicola]|uniref:CD3324 family protein n=1 Tax=Paenibacillus humicola TaxID=3110540 RepID=UPI00237AB4AE|nr:CD3324 family protein [Paenibacillus humicola]